MVEMMFRKFVVIMSHFVGLSSIAGLVHMHILCCSHTDVHPAFHCCPYFTHAYCLLAGRAAYYAAACTLDKITAHTGA